jgi:hypothetical protein
MTASPHQVSLVTPLDGSVVTTDSVALLWQQSSPLVDRYWVERDTSMSFGTSIVDSLVTDTSQVVAQLQHDERYWWRVRAHNQYGWGEYSEARNFLVYMQIPAAPLLIGPTDGMIVTDDSVVFNWEASPGAELYEIQVSEMTDFSSLFAETDSIASTSISVMGFVSGQAYYWRVRGSNTLGESDWSEVWEFSVLITDVSLEEGHPRRFRLGQNYPNPFNPTTSIRIEIGNPEFVSLIVFDLLGREVATLVNKELQPGRYDLSFDASGLSSGMYFYRIRAGAFQANARMMLVR